MSAPIHEYMSTLWRLGFATFQSTSLSQSAQTAPHLAWAVETDRSRHLLNSVDEQYLLRANGAVTSPPGYRSKVHASRLPPTQERRSSPVWDGRDNQIQLSREAKMCKQRESFWGAPLRVRETRDTKSGAESDVGVANSVTPALRSAYTLRVRCSLQCSRLSQCFLLNVHLLSERAGVLRRAS